MSPGQNHKKKRVDIDLRVLFTELRINARYELLTIIKMTRARLLQFLNYGYKKVDEHAVASDGLEMMRAKNRNKMVRNVS